MATRAHQAKAKPAATTMSKSHFQRFGSCQRSVIAKWRGERMPNSRSTPIQSSIRCANHGAREDGCLIVGADQNAAMPHDTSHSNHNAYAVNSGDMVAF